jgi:hypothetical protein
VNSKKTTISDHECNPSLIDIGGSGGNSTHYTPTGLPLPPNSIVSLIIWFCCLLYASIRTTSYTAIGKIGGTTGEGNAEGQDIPLSKEEIWERERGIILTPKFRPKFPDLFS